MLYFERTRRTIHGVEITLTSWLDKDRGIWRALAPRYVGIVHDWKGATGTSREEARDRLIALLAAHLSQPTGRQEAARGTAHYQESP